MASLPDQADLGSDTVTAVMNSGAESLRVRVRHAAREAESQIIREALEQHQWNRRRTAEALKISYRSLMYKMKTCNVRNAPGERRTAQS